MKKIFITIIACLGLGMFTGAHAQDDSGDGSKLRFGGQVSPVISWMTSDNSQVKSGGLNLGLKLGAIGEYHFAKNYSIAAGIGFGFNEGGKLQYTQGGNILPKSELPDIPDPEKRNLPVDTKVTYKLTFIEFPVSLKLRTREYGYMRYYAELPIITLSAITQGKANVDAANIDVNKQKVTSDMKRLNAQWGIGGGVEYNFSEDNALVLGAYYNQGFFDLTRNTTKDKAVDHNITIRVGVLF